MEDKVLCPVCKEVYFEEVMGALSRKNNETYMCSDCGTKEAIEELQKELEEMNK